MAELGQGNGKQVAGPQESEKRKGQENEKRKGQESEK